MPPSRSLKNVGLEHGHPCQANSSLNPGLAFEVGEGSSDDDGGGDDGGDS